MDIISDTSDNKDLGFDPGGYEKICFDIGVDFDFDISTLPISE